MNLASLLILSIGFACSLSFLVVMRLNQYFILQNIVLYPALLGRFNAKLRIWLLSALVIMSSFYYFWTLAVNGERYGLVPYNIGF